MRGSLAIHVAEPSVPSGGCWSPVSGGDSPLLAFANCTEKEFCAGSWPGGWAAGSFFVSRNSNERFLAFLAGTLRYIFQLGNCFAFVRRIPIGTRRICGRVVGHVTLIQARVVTFLQRVCVTRLIHHAMGAMSTLRMEVFRAKGHNYPISSIKGRRRKAQNGRNNRLHVTDSSAYRLSKLTAFAQTATVGVENRASRENNDYGAIIRSNGRRHLHSSTKAAIRTSTYEVCVFAIYRRVIRCPCSIRDLGNIHVNDVIHLSSCLRNKFAPAVRIVVRASDPRAYRDHRTLLLIFTMTSLSGVAVKTSGRYVFTFNTKNVS